MPSIAIIGAGPAGLTLARLLQNQAASIPSLEVTVFEHDRSAKSRFHQGGTLDLHPKTGLAAIRAAGLWDEAHKHLRYEGEEMKMGDRNGTVYVHMQDAPQIEGFDARPEIDRELLKDVLLQSVDPASIRWDKTLRSVNETTGVLSFADGSEAGPFDLVVGADGAWSKVRNVVSDIKPSYSGICGLGANINEKSAGDLWQSVSEQVGRGSYFNFSDGQALMAQRMGDNSLKVGVWTSKDKSWPADTVQRAGGDDSQIKRTLLNEFSTWHTSITRWIELADQFQPWPLYELPVGHSWEHKKGWTLIGDSAHLMTPFAGEGVNAAMKDALELGEAITIALKDSDVSLDEAVLTYEHGMFPRAKEVQQQTAFNKSGMFRSDAPVGFMVDMVGVAARETGHDLDKGWLAWIPVQKLAFIYFSAVKQFGIFRRRIGTLLSRS